MKTTVTVLGSAVLFLAFFCAGGCRQIPYAAIEKDLVKEKQAQKVIPEATKIGEYYIHSIKWPGENLGWISLWYTGSPNNWQHIIDANPSLSPEKIRVGDSIRIPENLLIKREPMPKNFRGRGNQSKPKPTQSPPPPPEEIELFGPID